MKTNNMNLIVVLSIVFAIFSMLTSCKNSNKTTSANDNLAITASNIKLLGDSSPIDKKHQIKIPVLMYHYVRDDNSTNELIVSPKSFDNQMKYLKENNIKTLSLDELYSILKRKSNPYEKSVVITFDDGYTDNYINAYPILKKYGQCATIFMISSQLNVKPDYFMTTDNIIELQANGIDIENHTAYHNKLGTLSYNGQVDDIETGKKTLENVLEKPIKYLAYPYGSYNSDTIKILKNSKHFMAFTTKKGYVTENSDLFELNRIMIFPTTTMDQFKNIVNTTFY